MSTDTTFTTELQLPIMGDKEASPWLVAAQLAERANEAIAKVSTIAIGGTGDFTPTDAQLRAGTIVLTGTLTGNRNVIVPARMMRKLFIDGTSGAFTVTVKCAATAGVVLSRTSGNDLWCDGSTVKAGLTATDGVDGVDGEGVPPGGTTGQALVKLSDDDFDTQWADVATGAGDMLAANNLSELTSTGTARFYLGLGSAATRDVAGSAAKATSIQVARGDDLGFIPSGGTTGQILAKNSGTDYDVEWIDAPSGGGGGGGGVSGALVRVSTAQSITSGWTWTDVVFDAAPIGSSPLVSLTNNRFVIQTTGWYKITLLSNFGNESESSGSAKRHIITINGAQEDRAPHFTQWDNPLIENFSNTFLVSLTSGDVLKMQVWKGESGTVNTRSQFWIEGPL
jgi:hypothetical protein